MVPNSLPKMRLLSDQELINILMDEQNHKVRTFNLAYTVAIERGLTSNVLTSNPSEKSPFSHQLVVSDSNVNTLEHRRDTILNLRKQFKTS